MTTRDLRVQNFLALAASGAYDGTLFHRNMKGFIVQGALPFSFTCMLHGSPALLQLVHAAAPAWLEEFP
jgi:hypothetical protein